MNSRERIKRTFNFQVPDRVGIFDAPWPETVNRWHEEGLPKDIHVNEYFNYDVDECVLLDTSFQLPARIIEKDEKYIVYSDGYGVTNRVIRNQTGAPLIVDYLVKNRDDWLKYKPLLKLSKERIKIYHWGEYETVSEQNIETQSFPDSWETTLNKYEKARSKGKFMFFTATGPFETARNFIDAKEVYIKLMDEPELIVDIFDTTTDLIIGSYKEIKSEGIEVDGFHLGDDIAYKNGMLFSPKTYKRLLFPCHKRLCDFFKSEGLPVMYHTDGKLDEALPLLIEAGITSIQPIEAKAGNDVKKLKEIYGKDLVFVGNIDVRKMSGSKEEMEEEIKSKILVAKENGGYLFHSDHSVPPTVSFENYKYVMEMINKHGKY